MLNFLLRMQLDLKFKKESGLSSYKDKITIKYCYEIFKE